MALNLGKQFEYAMIAAAYSKIKNASPEQIKKITEYSAKVTNDDVKNKAENMLSQIINQIGPRGPLDEFYKSFKLLGGTKPEPKTDIIFKNGGTTYKCSMKWGKNYQLSSAGIDGTVNVLRSILSKVGNVSGMSGQSSQKIAAVIDEINDTLGDVGIQQGSIVRERIKKAKQSGLLERLQNILGSPREPKVDEAFKTFKKEIIREALTGKIIFNNSDKSANYILNDTEFKEIDDTFVDSLVDRVYVGLRLKGRGKDPNNIRLNEISVRIEPQ